MVDQTRLFERAQAYAAAARKRLHIERRLGFGQDGVVWLSNQNTAIKAYERLENYGRELGCYQRLAEFGVRRIDQFQIPQRIGNDESLQVIEMTFVTPPFLLDFGKAYLDFPPDFSSEVLADWEQERSSLFDPGQWPVVQSLISQLTAISIYYYDAKPGNISFAPS
jgi:hypothetical protein